MGSQYSQTGRQARLSFRARKQDRPTQLDSEDAVQNVYNHIWYYPGCVLPFSVVTPGYRPKQFATLSDAVAYRDSLLEVTPNQSN